MQSIFHRTWHRFTNLKFFSGRVGLAVGGNILTGFAVMVAGFLTARLLGPHGRGEFAAIQSWSQVLALIATLGMLEAIVFFVSRDREKASYYLGTAIVLSLIGGSVIVGISWFLLPFLMRAQSAAIIDAARVFMVLRMLSFIFMGFHHQTLRGIGSWKSWNLFNIFPPTIWAITLVIFFVSGTQVSSIVLTWVYLGVIVGTIPAVIVAVRRHIQIPYTVQPELARPLLEYGIPSVLHVIPKRLNLRLDQMIMVGFIEPSLLGFYAVAVAWSNLSTPLYTAVGSVLFPHVSSIKEKVMQQREVTRIIHMTGIGTIGLTLLILLSTPVMLPLLFGADYTPSIIVALILVVANGFSGMNIILSDGLRGLGKPRSAMQAELIGLFITLILLFFLLKPYGIIGAGIASLCSYIVVFGSQFIMLRRLIH